MHADLDPFDDAGIDADAWHRRLAIEEQRARLRQIVPRRILRVHADLDRVAALTERVLRPWQRLARRDRDLRAHEVDAGDLPR